jgi:hypothetical protein
MQNLFWSAFKCGKPITADHIADLLRPFDISPRTQRDGSHAFKRYKRSQFKDAFSRYLNHAPGTRSQFTSGNQGFVLLKKHIKADVTDRQRADPKICKARDRVTDQGGGGHKVQAIAADQTISLCPHCSGGAVNKCGETGEVASENK